MPTSDIEAFAAALVPLVRDLAIRACDRRLLPDAKGPIAERWRSAGAQDNPIVAAVIPDIVDEVMFHLLDAIDNGRLPLSFTAASGRLVKLEDEGLSELAGWYIGSDGWRGQFSKERFVDDFKDVTLE